jgi:hypothetical protein
MFHARGATRLGAVEHHPTHGIDCLTAYIVDAQHHPPPSAIHRSIAGSNSGRHQSWGRALPPYGGRLAGYLRRGRLEIPVEGWVVRHSVAHI